MNPKYLNWVGGVPDLVLQAIPHSLLKKIRLSHDEYLDLLGFYDQRKWPQKENPFLSIPASAPDHAVIQSSEDSGCRLQVFRYPSQYRPKTPYTTERFGRFRFNQDGYVLLWRHSTTDIRPLILCIHGFQMGRPAKARRLFKIEKLLQLGVDVALYILPFHWKRAERAERHFYLNPGDIPLTVETYAQNLCDLHSAVLILKSLGYGKIGAIGASLGGYAAALYATLPAPLDFIFTVVPSIDVWDYVQPQSRDFPFEVDEPIRTASRNALNVVSPLSYSPVFDVNNIGVVLHGGDRICPPEFTRAWIEKWGIRNSVEVTGGHWLYLDRKIRGMTWYSWLKNYGYIGS